MTEPWTHDRKLAALRELRWTVTIERSADDNALVARVKELPDVIAFGATERALATDLWDSLTASLNARLEFEDLLVLPAGAVAPWLATSEQGRYQRFFTTVGCDAWEKVRPLTAATIAPGSASSVLVEVPELV